MSAHALPPDALPEAVPSPGTILADAYRVERVLATGGMGVVLAATEIAAERRVAIKVMAAAAAADPEQVARFRREAKAASSLTSEHVVRVLDFGELASGLPYLVMEHLDGTALVDVMKRRGPLPVAEAVDYVVQAIHGVAEAHANGIVHRDLKPANLFVTGDPDAPVVKVLDFGASKLTEDSSIDASDPGGVTLATSLIGSPRYMAPEQIRSALQVDARADIYALGATLHELLTGKPIFFADSLARIFALVLWEPAEALAATRDDVPAALEAVITRCLAKAPEDRYATVEALALALSPFAIIPAVTPRRAPPKPSPASGSKLVAARLFKPAEERPSPPARIDPAPVAVRAATAKMPRVKLASAAPKKTVRMAAFSLAARTVQMVRYRGELPRPPSPRAPAPAPAPLLARSPRTIAIAMAIATALLIALVATAVLVRG